MKPPAQMNGSRSGPALLAALVAAAIAASMTAAPPAAGAPPDPCALAVSLFCRLVPVAPYLDGDVDLTISPPSDPSAPPPESFRPTNPCAAGCI
jgi:hypothetical protein